MDWWPSPKTLALCPSIFHWQCQPVLVVELFDSVFSEFQVSLVTSGRVLNTGQWMCWIEKILGDSTLTCLATHKTVTRMLYSRWYVLDNSRCLTVLYLLGGCYVYIYTVCICMCLYTYICIYIYLCIYICIYTYIYMYLNIYVYIYIHMYIHLYTYIYTYTYIYIFTCIHIYVYSEHIYMFIYIYVFM